METQTVYIVQQRDWRWNDSHYYVDDETPVKAFTRRQDAETYRDTLERKAAQENDYMLERQIGADRSFYEVTQVEVQL